MARLCPVCEHAHSMMSSRRVWGTAFVSRCTVTAMNARPLGEVHASVAKFKAPSYACAQSGQGLGSKNVSTSNFAAIWDRMALNTCFTSRETVAGEGSRYSGRPVFINVLKARSLTIANGRLLSATHRTISTLLGRQKTSFQGK
jgi:hypothetical protein